MIIFMVIEFKVSLEMSYVILKRVEDELLI